MTTVHLTIDLPTDVDPAGTDALQVELRLLWVLNQVRRGRISVGKGAELASMDRWSFIALLGEHGIPVMAYPSSDLERELGALEGR